MNSEATGMPLPERVFAALGGEGYHSGETLAKALGVSRSAVWKAVQALEKDGAEIDAQSNRGYRLRQGTSVLSVPAIRAHLAPQACEVLQSLEVAWSIPSTNAALMAAKEPAAGRAKVLLAEKQTAGRGRRGRQWVAPLGGALSVSIGWTFEEMPRDLAALPLVVGVCAMRAIESTGATGIKLKWPNDLLVGDDKLGGILIEMRAESSGPVYVVIGIGLNVILGAATIDAVAAAGTRAIDLAARPEGAPDRNVLAANLISHILEGLPRFALQGLAAFGEEWRAADALRGRTISVKLADHDDVGIARGIDASGSLLVETREGLRRYMAGEVSVRPRP